LPTKQIETPLSKKESFSMPTKEVEDFLEHFGVRGMKWGVRKGKNSEGSPKQSRKERRAQAKAQVLKNREDKASSLVSLALKNQNNVLINLNGRVVVTGKEFVNHMSSGGLLDVRSSQVFAVRGASAEKEALRINSIKT
jgi:hypothetical protein